MDRMILYRSRLCPVDLSRTESPARITRTGPDRSRLCRRICAGRTVPGMNRRIRPHTDQAPMAHTGTPARRFWKTLIP